MSPESFRSWVQRMGPGTAPASTATDSVRYEMFGDRAAALAWRQRTSKRSSSKTGRMDVRWSPAFSSARSTCSTPEVAIAVCYAGLPRTIGPWPGTVTGGRRATTGSSGQAGRTGAGPGRGARSGSRFAGEGRPGSGLSPPRSATGTHRFPYSFLSASSSGRRGAARELSCIWGLRRTAGSLLGRADAAGLVVLDLRAAVERHGPGNVAGHRFPLGTGGAAGGAHDNAQGDPGPAARPDPCGRRDLKSASGQVLVAAGPRDRGGT